MQNPFDTNLIKISDAVSDTHGFIKVFNSPLQFNIGSLKDIFSSADIDVQQVLNTPHKMRGIRTVVAHNTLDDQVYVMFWTIEQTATDFFKILTKLKPEGVPKVDWLREFTKNINYSPVQWVIWSGAMRDESKILSVQMDTDKFFETNKLKSTWYMFTKFPVSLSFGEPSEWQPYPIGNIKL